MKRTLFQEPDSLPFSVKRTKRLHAFVETDESSDEDCSTHLSLLKVNGADDANLMTRRMENGLYVPQTVKLQMQQTMLCELMQAVLM